MLLIAPCLLLENDSNASNNSICYPEIDYCVESTIYRKVLGTIIFLVVWPFIVLDIKKFPLGRPAAALVGATLMVMFSVVPQRQVYIILGNKENLQTLFLLFGMMLLSYYYDREGILSFISLYIFGKDKPFKHVLWKVCVLSAVLSAIITNDATCVVLTPLLLKEHAKQERSKKEYAPLLLGIATSANIGSASTFFGNPQNAFIASNSQGQVSLFIFFITNLPAAVLGMVISVLVLYFCYFRTVWPKRDISSMPDGGTRNIKGSKGKKSDPPKAETSVHLSLADSRREFSLSYDQSDNPEASSQIAKERSELHVSMQNDVSVDRAVNSSSHDHTYGSVASISYPRARNSNMSNKCIQKCGSSPLRENSSKIALPELPDQENQIPPKSRCSIKLWRKRIFVIWLIVVTGIVIILLAIPPPPVVHVDFNLGLVPVGATVLTMLVDTIVNKKYAFDAMVKVDWTMLLMFMGLFIWLAGFQNTLFPKSALDFVHMYMDLNTVQGVLFFTVFVTFGSNVFSNVPLVILIVERLSKFRCGDNNCTSQLTGVLLAWVSTIAGNFTLIGSIANLIVAEKARIETGYRLNFLEYLKFGFCSTILVLFAGLPIVYFAGDNVSINVGA